MARDLKKWECVQRILKRFGPSGREAHPIARPADLRAGCVAPAAGLDAAEAGTPSSIPMSVGGKQNSCSCISTLSERFRIGQVLCGASRQRRPGIAPLHQLLL